MYRAPNIDDTTTTIAAIITSSGTTGMPKGVCLTHANLLAYCDLTFVYNKNKHKKLTEIISQSIRYTQKLYSRRCANQ